MKNFKKLEEAFKSEIPQIFDFKSFWNPDTCPSTYLDELAYSLYVEPYDKNWIDSKKREAIKASLFFYKTRGTDKAIKDALNSLDIDCELVYWHQDDSIEKGMFNIDVRHYQEVDRVFLEKVHHAINRVKRGSLHLKSVNMKQEIGSKFYSAVATHQTKIIKV